MRKVCGLLAACVVMASMPAFAEDSCALPDDPPKAVDGSTAAAEDITSAAHNANVYLKAATAYQDCIGGILDAKSKEAKAANREVAKEDEVAYATNWRKVQRVKERVGGQYNGALVNYCARKGADADICAKNK